METEEEGSLGDGVCRGQSPGCRAGQRMERNQMETSQDHLTGWPRLSSMSVERGSVTRGYSDLRLSQPLRSPHPRQPGHWQSRGDPLESLPLPATRLGHRVPLYPQRCEVLRQGGVFHSHVPLPHPAHAAGPRSHPPRSLEGHPVLSHPQVPSFVVFQGEALGPGVRWKRSVLNWEVERSLPGG